MSSEANTQAGSKQQFSIQRIYIKDLSFETPNSPKVFTEKWDTPNIKVDLNNTTTKVVDDVYEVVLNITVTCKLGETTAYLAEVQQAGLFTLAGFNDAEMGQMLHSFCPNILFPYAREACTDIVSRGSFPQLILSPVNFDALYAQHVQKLQQEQQDKSESAVH